MSIGKQHLVGPTTRKRTMMTTSGWRPPRSASSPPEEERRQARGEKGGEDVVDPTHGVRVDERRERR